MTKPSTNAHNAAPFSIVNAAANVLLVAVVLAGLAAAFGDITTVI